MQANIKILMLEDNPLDAKVIETVLENSSLTCTTRVVSDKAGFMAELEGFRPQVVLCDHMLADFNSFDALHTFKSKNLDIPFIVVTGKSDAQLASQILREGADDYIIKSNVDRLPAAINASLKRIEAENKLVSSEKKFRALIENSYDIITLKDANLQVIYHSPSVARITGWPNSRDGFLEHTHPEDAIRMKRIMKEVLMHPGFPVFTTFRVKHQRGEYIWLEGTITNRLHDPVINAIVANLRDVTEQIESYDKLLKSETAIRSFANNLNRIQEEEKINVAREIHDELGQIFAGMKMNVSRLNNENLETGVHDLKKDIDTAIQFLRKIVTQLRPGILDSLGLIPSVEWLGEEFTRKTGIKCTVVRKGKQERFGKDISNCFFRVCQESLTNITKHAEATEVSINIECDEGSLYLIVQDNGKGMTPEKIENPFSMGMLGMRERAHGIGGYLKVTSEKGAGTTIYLKANYTNDTPANLPAWI